MGGKSSTKNLPTLGVKRGLASMLRDLTIETLDTGGDTLQAIIRNKTVKVTKRASRIMINFSLYFRHEIYAILHHNDSVNESEKKKKHTEKTRNIIFEEEPPDLIKYINELCSEKYELSAPYKGYFYRYNDEKLDNSLIHQKKNDYTVNMRNNIVKHMGKRLYTFFKLVHKDGCTKD